MTESDQTRPIRRDEDVEGHRARADAETTETDDTEGHGLRF